MEAQTTPTITKAARAAVDLELRAPKPVLAIGIALAGVVAMLWAMFSAPGFLLVKLIVGFAGGLAAAICGIFALRQATRTVRVTREGIEDRWLLSATHADWSRIGGAHEFLFRPTKPNQCWAYVVRDRIGDRLFWFETTLQPASALTQLLRRIAAAE